MIKFNVASVVVTILFVAPSLFAQTGGNIIYQFDGTVAGERLGKDVATAGDVNGDGSPDFLVATTGADLGGSNDLGSVFVFSGADGFQLFRFDGSPTAQGFGESIAGLGDLNGDGRSDFIVGAPSADPGGLNNAGSIFVYSGMDGSILYQLNGANSTGRYGSSVAGPGDVNADGIPDFLVGARLASNLTGMAFVYSGLDGSELYRFYGSSFGDGFGESVSGAGDVNADGFADLIVGAPGFSPPGFWKGGAAYVFSGLDGSQLYRVDGDIPSGAFGSFVAQAGDLNADGFSDFAASPFGVDSMGIPIPGTANVYSGVDGSELYRFGGGYVYGDYGFAYSICSAGDIDSDGHDDFVLGAFTGYPAGVPSGSVIIYSGFDGSELSRIDGVSPYDSLGGSVSPAGDINGDGIQDIICGASGVDFGGLSGVGSAFVFSLVPPSSFVLSLTGSCPGSLLVDIFGGSPSGNIALVYGAAGLFVVPGGPCAGATLGISNPTLAGLFSLDPLGSLSFSTQPLPSGACGLTLQAVDVATCLVSNPEIL